MSQDHSLTEEDEGKKVINEEGDDIGQVVQVQHGNAHVEPDPGLTDTIMSKLGWGESDEDTYKLDSSQIESVTDDEIHVRM